MIRARRLASTKPKQGAASLPARLLRASILALAWDLAFWVADRVASCAEPMFATSNRLPAWSWNAISSPLQYSRSVSTHPNLSHKAVSVY
jgi:hypothetical protein